jgi:hypothetical protein
MSQCVVVCYDMELRAIFKVTLPMLYHLAYGQSFLIVCIVGVAALSLIQLTRQVRDWFKSSSLVLQENCRNPHYRCIYSRGEHRVRADLRKDKARHGNEP